LVVFGVGLLELKQHQKRVLSIPIRIHVNGTRGKSSVTRLIGAGLRAGGKRTLTKVTGTFPRLILESGEETYIHRKSSANIIEQLDIVRFAHKRNCEALVIECMALQPHYQWVTENQIIRATIGVMTNVRIDHTDVMGERIEEIAECLGNTIPKNFSVFTSEDENAYALEDVARKKNSKLIISKTDSVTNQEMKGFSYMEHKENVSLALDVCMAVGIDRSVALKGMHHALPDEGALKRSHINILGKTIAFYNAFAANDPDSSYMIWNKIMSDVGSDGERCILLNTRQDRLERSVQLAEMIATQIQNEADFVVLMGESSHVIESCIVNFGYEKHKVINLGWIDEAPQLLEPLMQVTSSWLTLVAMGNMGGNGAKVARYFEERDKVEV